MKDLKYINIIRIDNELLIILKSDNIDNITDLKYINNKLYVYINNKKKYLFSLKEIIDDENFLIKKIYLTDNEKFIINKENAESIIIDL